MNKLVNNCREISASAANRYYDSSYRYWIAQNQPNSQFWQHEFSKHATCFSSFDTGFNGTNNCYGVTYQEGEDIVDFYETVALHDLKYPSYDWLSAAGIVPSNTTSYKLSQFQDALTEASGALPFVSCSRPVESAEYSSCVFSSFVDRLQRQQNDRRSNRRFRNLVLRSPCRQARK